MKEEKMTQNSGLDALAALAAEMTEAAVIGQSLGLRVLLAEMQALTEGMPGSALIRRQPTAAPHDIEADFDNMPV
jgi:hypothetical protein